MHQCALCNETIEEVDIELGEVQIIGDEHWHLDCYAEYFDDSLEDAYEEA
jgi:hypothetical protein